MSKEAKQFRRDWFNDPSKEMIDEGEIIEAYFRSKIAKWTDEKIRQHVLKGEEPVSYMDVDDFDRGEISGMQSMRDILLK